MPKVAKLRVKTSRFSTTEPLLTAEEHRRAEARREQIFAKSRARRAASTKR